MFHILCPRYRGPLIFNAPTVTHLNLFNLINKVDKLVHAFADCHRYGYLINKSLTFKIMYRSIHRFVSVLENRKINKKAKLHNISNNNVCKFNLMQFLFFKKKKKNVSLNMLLPEFIFSQLVLK